ncbi:hypothetical protein Cni_G16889 [Canna indica]|uniref:FLZ-type domain-containing protein n=1 Tax=Canna indica TaxID=4628 RepID=A0AAQ3KHC9_9LILI|nr:hypothetical protein Cni_G16889 [Canna indica]
MLRAMNKVQQKDQSKGQPSSDSSSDSCFPSNGLMQKAKNPSLFSVPRLFVGFSTKGLPDSDSVRSPTSPLDYKSFSNLSNSFLGSPRSGSANLDGKPRCWDCSRVGLSLVDTLSDETKPCGGKFVGFSGSRNILLAPQMRSNISSPKTHLGGMVDGAAPKSLPKDYGMSSHIHKGSLVKPLISSSRMSMQAKGADVGIHRSCSAEISRSSSPLTESIFRISKSDSKCEMLDSSQLVKGSANFDNFSGSLPVSIGSSSGVITSLSASEIEQSEDYTCIISHGPNPKTTHIFGDCILESHSFPSKDLKNKHKKDQEWLLKPSEDSLPCSSSDFLSFCYFCKKKLEEGKDIYMYRGEKAFCSCECRDQEILIEEEMENPTINSPFEEEEMFLLRH